MNMHTAKSFLQELQALRTAEGIRMGAIFALAKKYTAMSLPEVCTLLANPMHEARVGAVSIMDFKARDKKTSSDEKKELFELYLRHHGFINTWDLVDRSAIYVIGGYLADKPKERKILYALAGSRDVNERRTAAVATFYFIMKQNDVEDAFQIAELLLTEKETSGQLAAGWVLREAGKHEPARLITFLDKHAAAMPRPMLRNAIEKLPPEQKARYMRVRKA